MVKFETPLLSSFMATISRSKLPLVLLISLQLSLLFFSTLALSTGPSYGFSITGRVKVPSKIIYINPSGLIFDLALISKVFDLALISAIVSPLFFNARSFNWVSCRPSYGFSITGRVKLPNLGAKAYGVPGRISDFKVILNGGQKVTYLRSDGYFSFHDVPAGTHLVEVAATGYFFSPVRLDVSARNPGKVQAALTETRRSLVELVLEPLRTEEYYEMREPFSIWSIVKSPMGLMVGFMLIVVLVMPKMMEGLDPEEMKQAQEQMRSRGIPSVPNLLAGAGRN